jgi:F-type H+-transporting ATPase subunit delta
MALVSGRARRLAEAAFDVARSSETLDIWEEQIAEVSAILSEARLRRAFASPVMAREQKESMLLGAFPDLDVRVRNFLALLVRQDKIDLLPDILTTFHELLNKQRGIQIIEVTSAEPLDQADRDRVAERLASYLGKEVVIEARVDPSIIGGLVARIGDMVLDGSVRGRLERLRTALARPA